MENLTKFEDFHEEDFDIKGQDCVGFECLNDNNGYADFKARAEAQHKRQSTYSRCPARCLAMGYQPRKGKDPVKPPKGGTGQSGG